MPQTCFPKGSGEGGAPNLGSRWSLRSPRLWGRQEQGSLRTQEVRAQGLPALPPHGGGEARRSLCLSHRRALKGQPEWHWRRPLPAPPTSQCPLSDFWWVLSSFTEDWALSLLSEVSGANLTPALQKQRGSSLRAGGTSLEGLLFPQAPLPPLEAQPLQAKSSPPPRSCPGGRAKQGRTCAL